MIIFLAFSVLTIFTSRFIMALPIRLALCLTTLALTLCVPLNGPVEFNVPLTDKKLVFGGLESLLRIPNPLETPKPSSAPLTGGTRINLPFSNLALPFEGIFEGLKEAVDTREVVRLNFPKTKIPGVDYGNASKKYEEIAPRLIEKKDPQLVDALRTMAQLDRKAPSPDALDKLFDIQDRSAKPSMPLSMINMPFYDTRMPFSKLSDKPVFPKQAEYMNRVSQQQLRSESAAEAARDAFGFTDFDGTLEDVFTLPDTPGFTGNVGDPDLLDVVIPKTKQGALTSKVKLPLSVLNLPLNTFQMPMSKFLLPLARVGTTSNILGDLMGDFGPFFGGDPSKVDAVKRLRSLAEPDPVEGPSLFRAGPPPKQLPSLETSKRLLEKAKAEQDNGTLDRAAAAPAADLPPGYVPLDVAVGEAANSLAVPGPFGINDFGLPYSFLNNPLGFMNMPFAFTNLPFGSSNLPFAHLNLPLGSVNPSLFELLQNFAPFVRNDPEAAKDVLFKLGGNSSSAGNAQVMKALQDFFQKQQRMDDSAAFANDSDPALRILEDSAVVPPVAAKMTPEDFGRNLMQQFMPGMGGAAEDEESVSMAEKQKSVEEYFQKIFGAAVESKPDVESGGGRSAEGFSPEAVDALKQFDSTFRQVPSVPQMGGLFGTPNSLFLTPFSLTNLPLSFLDNPLGFMNLPLSHFNMPFAHLNLPFGGFGLPLDDINIPPAEPVTDPLQATIDAADIPPSLLEVLNPDDPLRSYLNMPLSEMNLPFGVFDLPFTVFDMPFSFFNTPLSQINTPLTHFHLPFELSSLPFSEIALPFEGIIPNLGASVAAVESAAGAFTGGGAAHGAATPV